MDTQTHMNKDTVPFSYFALLVSTHFIFNYRLPNELRFPWTYFYTTYSGAIDISIIIWVLSRQISQHVSKNKLGHSGLSYKRYPGILSVFYKLLFTFSHFAAPDI